MSWFMTGARRRACLASIGMWCAVSVLVAPAHAVAEVAEQKNWKRLETPNFALYGNGSDGDLRAVAERLEQFRDAMGMLFGGLRPAANRPRVVVFRNHRSYDPFKPQYNGKPAPIGGYFLSGSDVSLITLTTENRDENIGVIYHEYVHLLMADSITSVPTWVSEGIAEYYSSFATSANGKQVLLGRPHVRHVRRLQTDFMPLETLTGVGRDSSHYNERDKQGVFYAQSWALVHYLLLGNQQRYSSQLHPLIAAIANGATFDDACRKMLGIESSILEKELRAYINRGVFMQQVATFDERLDRLAKLPVTPIPDAEAYAVLGDVLFRLGRLDDAEAHLARALERDPESTTAHTAMGQVRLRQDRYADARTHLERAARRDTATYLTHMQLAYVLHQIARSADAPKDDTLMAAQEAALRTTVELNPEFAEGWFRLGVLRSTQPDGMKDALAIVAKAATLAPGEESYTMTLAQLHANAQNIVAARAVARTLAQRAADPDIRTRAQDLFDRLGVFQREMERAKAAEAAAGVPADTSDARFEDAGGTTSTFVPDLRAVQDGEYRVSGFLLAIECPANAVVIHLDADGTRMTLRADKFEAIDFISYRDDLRGAISCGKRTTLDPVVATYRPDASLAPHAGTVVAVEFIPKGYLPKL